MPKISLVSITSASALAIAGLVAVIFFFRRYYPTVDQEETGNSKKKPKSKYMRKLSESQDTFPPGGIHAADDSFASDAQTNVLSFKHNTRSVHIETNIHSLTLDEFIPSQMVNISKDENSLKPINKNTSNNNTIENECDSSDKTLGNTENDKDNGFIDNMSFTLDNSNRLMAIIDDISQPLASPISPIRETDKFSDETIEFPDARSLENNESVNTITSKHDVLVSSTPNRNGETTDAKLPVAEISDIISYSESTIKNTLSDVSLPNSQADTSLDITETMEEVAESVSAICKMERSLSGTSLNEIEIIEIDSMDSDSMDSFENRKLDKIGTDNRSKSLIVISSDESTSFNTSVSTVIPHGDNTTPKNLSQTDLCSAMKTFGCDFFESLVNKCEGNRKQDTVISESQLPSNAEIEKALLHAATDAEHMDYVSCEILVNLLKLDADCEFQQKIVDLILQCSAFSSKHVFFYEAGCVNELTKLLNSLENQTNDPDKSRLLCSVCNILTNLVQHEPSFNAMHDCIQPLFNVALNPVSPSIAKSHTLQSLTNLCIRPMHHRLFTAYIQDLLMLLNQDDPSLTVHVLRVLINLSCNTFMLPHLLKSQVSSTAFTLLLPEIDPQVSLRWLTFLNNLSSAKKLSTSGIDTVPENSLHHLLNNQKNLSKLKPFITVLQKHSNNDVQEQAIKFMKLYDI